MDYLIGAGAILEGGENGGIRPAAVHAHVDEFLARRARAAAIDFESGPFGTPSRLVTFVRGWNAAQFRRGVSEKLLAERECSLEDVFCILARAADSPELHLFARWLPDESTCAGLRSRGIELIAHPLESIGEAAIVSGQRHQRMTA